MHLRALTSVAGLVVVTACITSTPASEARPPSTVNPTAPSSSVSSSGVQLHVSGAPAETTIEVLASDERPPLVERRLLGSDPSLGLSPGFVTIVLDAGGDQHRIGVYVREGARIDHAWGTNETIVEGDADLLDRAQAEVEWAADMRSLMEAIGSWNGQGALPADARARLDAQRAAIEALGDTPYAHLRRLRQASFVAQIEGPEAAWAIAAPVPADSIAWAAYSPWLVELAWFLRDIPEANARLDRAGESAQDMGLRSAFTARGLIEAERSGRTDALAEAQRAATRVDGPIVVGQPLPSFELRSVDGRSVIRSEELLGTACLLEVWSTWCKPCIAGMRPLHDLHEELGSGDAPPLRIVSIAIDDTREPVVVFRRDRWPMPWLDAWVPGGDPLGPGWGFEGVPWAVLVDADGVVRAAGRHVDFEEVRRLTRGDAEPSSPSASASTR